MSDSITDILPPTKAPRSISVGKLAPGTLKRTEPATIPPGDFADLVEQARQILINRSAYGTKSLRDIIVERLGVDMDTAYQLIDAIAVEATPGTAIAPATPAAPSESLDAQMGQQLTDQYQRAIGGMREVLKFGAMMLQVREHVKPRLHVRSHGGKIDGSASKGSGLKAWLTQYAPEIKEATAYRFMRVAEVVQEAFRLPVKVAKELTFAELATSDPDELPEKARALQLDLWAYVDGTSQRSWLDRLKPLKPAQDKPDPADDDKAEDTPEQAAIDIWTPIMRDLELHGISKPTWQHLPQQYQERLDGILIDLDRLRKDKNQPNNSMS